MTNKILFIINPISGIGKQKSVEKNIKKYLDKNKYQSEIIYTKYAKHAIEISSKAANNYKIIVAVGGDGSVNEVSRGLINSDTALAIIPAGSGNGLARHLKIPLKIIGAIKNINNGTCKEIDIIKLNEEFFVNVAGVGFDAHISHLFAEYGKRGRISYIKLINKEFINYQPQKYSIIIDEKEYIREAFLLSLANSSQFGNNAHISPMAKVDDGLIDLCILKKFPFYKTPDLAQKLFFKTIDKSKYIEIIKTKKLIIRNKELLKVHIDGEPITIKDDLNINVLQGALKVIVPCN
ncbi:MAG: diacylglycerol kinase family lipid kinase [Bacteroidales bacterium]|nr:diacylglycerol kinase family lipid kinase [Bacteroidales bacterium]